MCYFVTIIRAQPDHKRPSIDIQQKVCLTKKDVDDFKRDYTVSLIEDHCLLDYDDTIWQEHKDGYSVLVEENVTDDIIEKLWKSFDNYDWHDGYMDMKYLEMRVEECKCKTH